MKCMNVYLKISHIQPREKQRMNDVSCVYWARSRGCFLDVVVYTERDSGGGHTVSVPSVRQWGVWSTGRRH